MTIINVPKQMGKTSYLLRRAQLESLPILVSTNSRKDDLKYRALHQGILGIEIYSVHEFIHARGKFTRNTKVLIDEMDDVLREFVGYTIEAATCTIPFSETFEGRIEE